MCFSIEDTEDIYSKILHHKRKEPITIITDGIKDPKRGKRIYGGEKIISFQYGQ